MSTDNILETSVDIKWLQKILIEVSASGKALPKQLPSSPSWSAEKIGEGMGFLSHIIRVKFNWSRSREGLPKSVVLKVPTFQSMEQVVGELAPDIDKDMLPKDFAFEVRTCALSK